MALINPLRDVILMSPLEWDAWDEVLKTKVKSNDLWGYIDPSICHNVERHGTVQEFTH